MKKTWMVVFALLLTLVMLGCAGAEESEAIGTRVSERASYCPTCDIDVYTVMYGMGWHEWVCPQCNQTTPNDGGTHDFASCDAPDTCLTCGASGVEVDRVRCNNNRLIQHSATQHWVICADCGQYLDYNYEHWSYCDTPTVCAFCKEDDVVIAASNVVHSDEADTEIRHDDTRHWWYCTGCGEDHLWPETHERDCEDDYCRVCKRSDVTVSAVRHTNTIRGSVSSTLCGEYCTDCGELIDAEPHWGYCTNPGICARCDASGVTLEKMYHTGGSDLEHDSTYHWSACRTCGEAQYKEKHYAICSNPDHCIYCGADGITARVIEHDWDSYVPGHNNTHCWSECGICGEKEAVTRHFTTDCTKPSLCESCGTSGVSCIVYHSYEVFDISGGHFYIATAEYDANGHWWTCADCGDNTRYNHSFNQENLCVACGYQAEDPCEHPKSTWVYEPYDEYDHIAFCGECGSPMYFETQDGYFLYGEHTSTCATPDVCIYCGGTDIVANDTVHSTKTKFLHDSTAHWRGCADCGAILDVSTVEKHAFVDLACTVCGYESAHTQHTFEDYVCTVCGHKAFEDALGTFTYTEDSAWCSDCSVDVYTGVYTQTECWFACPECCKIIHRFGEHRASCDEPGVCTNCHASGVTISEITHWDSTAKYNSTHHWEECACGEQSNRAEHTLTSQWNDTKHWTGCTECDYVFGYQNNHTADCTDPDICRDCGQSDVTIYEVVHDWTTLFNDTYHWTGCVHGDANTSMQKHYVSVTKYVRVSDTECGRPCHYCDYIYPSTSSHEVTCAAPTTCVNCGGTDVIAEEPEHNYDWDTYVKVSDTECTNPCIDCGAYSPYTSCHVGTCQSPTTCQYCGAADITVDTTTHVPADRLAHDNYYHWNVCKLCNTPLEWQETGHIKFGHIAACGNPNTCIDCGASGVYMQSVDHCYYDADSDCYEYYDEEYAHNQTHHWYYCPGCNEVTSGLYEHSAYCTSPSACRYCAAEDISAVIEHDDYQRVSISSTQHQYQCSDCGEGVDAPSNHYGSCMNPNYCTWCHASGITAVITHSAGDEYGHNNTHHWKTCSDCGAPCTDHYEYGEHTANCTTPTVCLECGATDITATYEHVYPKEPAYDNTHHWDACVECGTVIWKERHESWDCTKPDVCEYCEATGVNCFVLHDHHRFDNGHYYHVGPVFSSADGHWWHCTTCGDETVYPHEYDEDGICEECDYKKPSATTRIPGDANSDGRVTLTDAILILEHASGASMTINLSNANVNADSDVDIRDALIILQHAAGWNVVLK